MGDGSAADYQVCQHLTKVDVVASLLARKLFLAIALTASSSLILWLKLVLACSEIHIEDSAIGLS